MQEVYMPREDTELILRYVNRFAEGNVLDMGTGSGILARKASNTKGVKQVIAVDINKNALNFAKTHAKGISNIKFIHSDLFSAFKSKDIKFDLIIFNPPYLPYEKEEPEEIRAYTTGGKHGYEIIEKFIQESSEYLMPYGKILLIFSTLTGKDKIHEILEENAFSFQKIAEDNFFHESIFLYLIEKSKILIELESKGMKEIRQFNRGQRGIIYTARWHGKKVAIKVKNPASKAQGRIINEARWLKLLNRRGIGPKILFHTDDYFCYEYIAGVFIEEFMEQANKTEIKKVLKDVFEQCFKLDKIGVTKEEMHNPYKHIIIEKNLKPVLIDFERSHATEKPKNVSQFCQYITSGRVQRLLKKKNFKFTNQSVRSASSTYKKNLDKSSLNKIIKLLK